MFLCCRSLLSALPLCVYIISVYCKCTLSPITGREKGHSHLLWLAMRLMLESMALCTLCWGICIGMDKTSCSLNGSRISSWLIDVKTPRNNNTNIFTRLHEGTNDIMGCGEHGQRSLSRSLTQTVPLLNWKEDVVFQAIIATPSKGIKMHFVLFCKRWIK